jgi:predicted phage-related endonuclease
MNDILNNLGLTADQKKFRNKLIGGSDANIIMGGENEKILNLWNQKRGVADGEDLSDVLPVNLGQFTEPFNRAWFTKQTKREVTNVGDQRICLDHPFMGCTLDGLTDKGSTLWEAKHVFAFYKEEDVLEKYLPQLTHNMIVCGLKAATLSVIFGNHKYVALDIELDDAYAAGLIEAEENFWHCVQNDIEPVIVAQKYTGPVVKIVDFTGNNAWASSAKDFLETEAAAKKNTKAKDAIKKMIEADVAVATGHGIIAKRSSNGAITIKEA